MEVVFDKDNSKDTNRANTNKKLGSTHTMDLLRR